MERGNNARGLNCLHCVAVTRCLAERRFSSSVSLDVRRDRKDY